MEVNKIHMFFNKIKHKLTDNKQNYPINTEYAFSSEEIADLNKQNKQKIQDLKQDIIPKPKPITKVELTVDSLNLDATNNQEQVPTNEIKKIEENKLTISTEEQVSNSNKEDNIKEVEVPEKPKTKNSFTALSDEHQKLVMTKWQEIESNEIDKDIIDGKDLLNHNYTITYADDASKYIHNIRKKYEIVLCYLIGFNNEKKGFFNKTIFSDKIDNEWKYLSNYIKILEKIRNFKKQ